MKILILTHHSQGNADLAALTAPNKWRYAASHSYDLMTLRMEWEDAKLGALLRLRDLLPLYDYVMMVGSDVVFTHFDIRLCKFIEGNILHAEDLTLCKESLPSGFPLNNDVCIWRGGESPNTVLRDIIYASTEWLGIRWLWQEWLAMALKLGRWNCPEVPRGALAFYDQIDRVQLLPARAMNSCHQEGPGKWQEGDFIFHAVDYTHAEKLKLCELYLGRVKK